MQTMTVTGGNLFDIANRTLGDASQWYVIAATSGIADPWLNGLTTLIIPDSANAQGNGIVAD